MTQTTYTNNLIKLADLGLIQVSGKKAAQFLQGQLTCDVNAVNSQQSRLGAHCDVKGRIQATFRLFFHQDSYYFLLPRRMQQHLLQCLQKYAVFSAVDLVDTTQNWEIIGLTDATITHSFNEPILLPQKTNEVITSTDSISLAVSHSRFILLSSNQGLLSFNNTTPEKHSVNTWHLLDIMDGIATIYPETIGQFTPHQLNYPAIGAVSFEKGCYIGQEIIARTHYLGKSKIRLYHVTFKAKNDFPPGTSLQDEKNARQGTLIMSAYEKNGAYQALACLPNHAISHTIHLENPQGPILKILELPYPI
jgi:tRNA-modifying protein YgfZ